MATSTADDLATIGSNWLKSVSTPFHSGDANGDSFVNLADLEIFDRNQNRAYFGPLPARSSPITGDLTGNGIVNEFDLNIVTANLNRKVTPGTNGDVESATAIVDDRRSERRRQRPRRLVWRHQRRP